MAIEQMDPDVTAELYVMQWMHENGHYDALRSLEKQVGRLYDDSQLPEASRLMQLVWRDCEERLTAQQEAEDEAAGAGAATHSSTAAASGAATSAGVGVANSESDPAAAATASAAAQRRARQEEALRLLRAGCGDYAGPRVLAETPPELHRANVIAVRIVPGSDCVITAAGDGVVRCVRLQRTGGGGSSGSGSSVVANGGEGASDKEPAAGGSSGGGAEVVWETRVGSAALLSLALHPQYGSGLPLVAVGSMDGRLAVLHGPTGRCITELAAHTKYVVRVAWGASGALGTLAASAPAAGTEGDGGNGSGGGGGGGASASSLLLATASNDETVGVHRLELALDVGDASGTSASDAADGVAGGSGGCGVAACTAGRLTTVKQVPYGAAVADVAFLPNGRTLAVGVRGSNYLRLLDTVALLQQAGGAGGGSCGTLPEALVNMNESGDDHVSFSPRQLVVSHCGKYLLVATDGPRLLVMRTSDWSVLRMLFGLPVDTFPQPVAAWHRDSNYIYAAGANAQLCVFHLGSGRLVASLRHHRINLRDLDYDPARNLLATCSFDKTVKLMGPQTA